MLNFYRSIFFRPISVKNKNEYFIIDESDFTSLFGKPSWVLDIIRSFSKKFRIELVDNKNTETIKNFINRYRKGKYNCFPWMARLL